MNGKHSKRLQTRIYLILCIITASIFLLTIIVVITATVNLFYSEKDDSKHFRETVNDDVQTFDVSL